MKKDGHSERFRAQVTKSVINKWKERQELDRLQLKTYYRGKIEREAEQKSNN